MVGYANIHMSGAIQMQRSRMGGKLFDCKIEFRSSENFIISDTAFYSIEMFYRQPFSIGSYKIKLFFII